MKKFLIGLGVVIVALLAGLWLYIPTAITQAVHKSIAKLQAKGYEVTATPTITRRGFVLYPTITLNDITVMTPDKTTTVTLADAELHIDGIFNMTLTVDGHNGTTTAPVVKRIGSATFAGIDAMVTVDTLAMVMGTDIKPLSHIEGMIENITFANRAYGQTGLQDIRLSATVYGTKLWGADGVKLTQHWANQGGYIDVQSLTLKGNPLDHKTPPMQASYKGKIMQKDGGVTHGWSTQGMLQASPFSSLLDILVKWKKIPKKVVSYTDLVMLLLGGQVQGDILTIPLSYKETQFQLGKLAF